MKLNILQNIAGEVQLCGGWCTWSECNKPKWICVYCGYVECDSCSEDYDAIVLTEEQQAFGLAICRNCRRYNSTDEFPDEWSKRKTLKLEYTDGDLRIAESVWNQFTINVTVPDDATIGDTSFKAGHRYRT